MTSFCYFKCPRPSLFGGARPREQVCTLCLFSDAIYSFLFLAESKSDIVLLQIQVLKERGVDVLASDLEKTSPAGRLLYVSDALWLY